MATASSEPIPTAVGERLLQRGDHLDGRPPERYSQFTDTSNLSEDGLQSAADDVKSSTQTLVDDLKGLGAPDTDSGQEVRRALDDLSTTLETESTSIQETAQGVSGLTEHADGDLVDLDLARAMGTAFSEALTTIQDADAKGELQGGLQDSPECADIIELS